ncbi:hypothetical protein GCM10027418_26430 [Mariniluteicoccus endophyticus]
MLADTTPLRNPHFSRLWYANIITVIGAQLTVVAVPAQIYEVTKSSGYVGLTGLFGLVPLVIFGLWGGALADVFDRRRLLMVTTIGLIAMIFGMPRALFPEIAHAVFGGPAGGGLAFAMLFAAIPTGAVAGGILSGWVSRVERHGLAVTVSILVWGLAIVGFGLALWPAGGRTWPWLAVAVFFLAVGGAADTASAAFRTTMLQTAANDSVRGRLQGVFIVVVAGGPRVADVVHGAASDAVGPVWTSAGGGALVVVLTLVAVALAPVFVRYRAER